jgi:hypothetical protein
MSDSEIRDDYARILHHAGYDRLVAPRTTNRNACLQNADLLKIQSGSNGPPSRGHRSHALPARLEEAVLLGETQRRNRNRSRCSAKTPRGLRPGTLRQFQFPESTDLQGRVKLCTRTRRPAIGDDHGDNGSARITPGAGRQGIVGSRAPPSRVRFRGIAEKICEAPGDRQGVEGASPLR